MVLHKHKSWCDDESRKAQNKLLDKVQRVLGDFPSMNVFA